MKKTIALLLAIVMVLGLVACGGETTPDATEPQAGNETTASAEQHETTPVAPLTNAERYPLEGTHNLIIAVTTDIAATDGLFALMADTVGITPEYQVVTKEQAPLLFAAETLPDMFFAPHLYELGLNVNQVNEYGKAGLLVNFKDYLDQMPNLKRVYEEHPQWFTAVEDFDGAFYTIPGISFTLTSSNNHVYFRTDHMAEIGWEKAPSTPEEFTQYLRDLKAHFGAIDPDYIPFTAYNASQMEYNAQLSRAWFPTFGELMENNITVAPDGKTIVAGFTTEQYQRYLKYVKSLMDEGLLDPNCLTANSDIQKAFEIEGHCSVSTQMTNIPADKFASGLQEISLFTPFVSEYSSTPRWAMPNLAGDWAGMISTKCEDMDAAIAYLDAFFAPADDPLDEEGKVWSISFYLGALDTTWEWIEENASYVTNKGSEFKGYSTAPYIGIWDKVEYRNGAPRYKAKATSENLLPYAVEIIRPENLTLDEEGVEIYNDNWPDIKTYLDQMNTAFLSGEADIDADFDEFVANLEAMGLNEVLEVYQAALDRYLAK